MLTKILLLLILVFLIGYLWLQRKNANKKTQASQKLASKTSGAKTTVCAHRCVVIQPGLISCKAVRAYKGRRILMHEAPTLPVQGCDVQECECKFLRYNDRRSGSRRTRVKVAAQFMPERNINKRLRKDRRNT